MTRAVKTKENVLGASLVEESDRMMSEKEMERIEAMAGEAEVVLDEGYDKKDLKEKRGVIKQTMYDGSKKLKHIIPKGKRT